MQNSSIPIQAAFAQHFAQDWIESWNCHDLERILTHYDDGIVLISPVALALLQNGTGVVQGKTALRTYFTRGLQAFPNSRFDLIDVFWGVETIVLHYANNVRGTKTAEVMQLTPAGKVVRVWANYDQ